MKNKLIKLYTIMGVLLAIFVGGDNAQAYYQSNAGKEYQSLANLPKSEFFPLLTELTNNILATDQQIGIDSTEAEGPSGQIALVEAFEAEVPADSSESGYASAYANFINAKVTLENLRVERASLAENLHELATTEQVVSLDSVVGNLSDEQRTVLEALKNADPVALRQATDAARQAYQEVSGQAQSLRSENDTDTLGASNQVVPDANQSPVAIPSESDNSGWLDKTGDSTTYIIFGAAGLAILFGIALLALSIRRRR